MSLSEMNKEQHDETCAALAAICLADGELTGDNISKIIAASGNEVEVYWPMLIGKIFSDKTAAEIIATMQGGSGGGGGGGGGGGDGGGEAEEEKEEEKEEEEEIDMGGGDMFGGDDDDY